MRCAISDDGLTYRFPLRPEARFHDGTPLTAHDVAFSLKIAEGEGPSDHRAAAARFRRAPKRSTTRRWSCASRRSAAATCRCSSPACRSSRGLLREARRSRRSTLESPLGSGPYKVGRFEAGRYIEFERVKDWWGAEPAGHARPAQFRRRALRISIATATSPSKASPARAICSARNSPRASGRRATISRRSTTAASSATMLPDETPSGAQGWFINTRRDEIQGSARARGADLRLRLRMDQQEPSCTAPTSAPHSVFQNSDMMANGKPVAEELALLEPFRGKVPDEVFGEPFVPPVSDGSGQDRACCAQASQLLQRGRLRRSRTASASTPTGERVHDRVPARRAVVPAASHALHQEPRVARHRRHVAPRRSGAVPARASTTSISTSRSQRFSFSATPGDSLRTYFSSQSAAIKGSQNLAGIADPAIDALIDKIIARQDAAGADHRLPGARPRDPRRALLGAALVQGVALDRLLGHVRPAGASKPRYARGIPRNLVVRSRTRRRNSSDEASVVGHDADSHDAAYILRRTPVHDPDPARDHAGVVRRGAVRAGRPGRARDRAAVRLRHRRHLAHLRLAAAISAARGQRGRRGVDAVTSKYRGAQGLDPEFIKQLEKQFGFDKPAHERFFLMLWNYRPLRFRQELFPRRQRARS